MLADLIHMEIPLPLISPILILHGAPADGAWAVLQAVDFLHLFQSHAQALQPVIQLFIMRQPRQYLHVFPVGHARDIREVPQPLIDTGIHFLRVLDADPLRSQLVKNLRDDILRLARHHDTDLRPLHGPRSFPD